MTLGLGLPILMDMTTTQHTHTCNSNPELGAVCTRFLDLDGDMLSALGFAVEKHKADGCKVRDGKSFVKAREDALDAKLLVTCTRLGGAQ